MTIRNGSKAISFTIEGYQYPHHKVKSKDFDYDANWLDVKIVYTDESGEHQYTNACLLTYELEELVEEISDVFFGEESLYVSDFMEPYLKISVSKSNEIIMCGIGYVYDTSYGFWKQHKIAEIISPEEAKGIIEELTSMINEYPKR